MSIERVAVVGVTAVTRSRNKVQKYAQNIGIEELEYLAPEKFDQLIKIFETQDAVVSVVGPAAITAQRPLIEAAEKAGVKHIIPSTFCSMGGEPRSRELPGYENKHDLQDWLKEKYPSTKKTPITWTTVNPGAFIDLILNSPFLVDFEIRKCQSSGTMATRN
ncbi:hypothetical protein LTR10_023976 [Elasticomyces elasticus]|uniref:NAD(P)-binding domain-containing protein n=1 Tax=Exophiala sideris TaxID=1016849 RepID=A0ABR0IUH5_9EURO|nr:hypothetical protein LTR10_023976 [Elasticomyces elasticus]KAK5020925.1 hypothetical protein LTS07_011360 [Exophiala sideris]KAK5022987.1 hypothetical protein LTR13_011372 [Exophiala sideris]KAK5048472.1 hypothetical protein LTR69_011340 [Exophiala sideris]KAK5176044.1 hypothetical protein LTR44_011403 [Eurotiomycetes sp. CCFEE 6388]